MEPTLTPQHSNKKLGIGIAVAAIIAIIAVSVFAGRKPVAVTEETSGIPQQPATAPTGTTKTSYKNGTYTATGSYMSPGGPDQIDVTVTLKDDIVTAVSMVAKPGDDTSAKFQATFAANYKQYVIGKNIATLSLDKVSGSSLTPKGFNDAIAQIKVKAKA